MNKNPDWSTVRPKLALDATAFIDSTRETDRALNHYVLIDAAQVPELRDKRFLAAPFEHQNLFALTREHGIAKYGPLLCPVRAGQQSPAFMSALRAMRHGWTVSWLSSRLSPDTLAAHLAANLNGTLADGTDVLVRFYDPRMLPHFLAHLDAPGRDALLAPIAQWGWWDRTLKFVSTKGGDRDDPPRVNEIEVSAQAQQALAASAMSELIKSMVIEASDADEFSGWLPHALSVAVDRQLENARKRSLTEVSDLQLYVSLALRVHPDFFDLIPAFRHASEALAAGDTDLTSLVLDVSDDEWDRVGGAGVPALDLLREQINKSLYFTNLDTGN